MAKDTEQFAQLVEHRPPRVACGNKRSLGLIRIIAKQVKRSAGLHVHHRQVVGQQIVQLTGDRQALLADLLLCSGLRSEHRRPHLGVGRLPVATPRADRIGDTDGDRGPSQPDHRPGVAELGVVANQKKRIQAAGHQHTQADRTPSIDTHADRRQHDQRGEDHLGRPLEDADVGGRPRQSDPEQHQRRAPPQKQQHDRADTGGHVGPAGVEGVR